MHALRRLALLLSARRQVFCGGADTITIPPRDGGSKMKWMLAGGWPIRGGFIIPVGTVITAVVGPDGEFVFDHTGVTAPMPINSVAQHEDAALQMCMWYEETDSIGGWHQLHFAPGIDRDAVMAKARHNKRWPNGVPSNRAVKEEKPGPG
jgi:hypothetical protein